jgi:hypothetical protein
MALFEFTGEPNFQIEGPDGDGYVWICSSKGREVWCHNLGPKDQVAAVMSGWLASIEQEIHSSEPFPS